MNIVPTVQAQVTVPTTYLPPKWQALLTNLIPGWCTGGPPPTCDFSIGLLVSTLLPNVLVLAGVIFFGLILAGGFGMIVGAGKQANPQEASKAKAAVTYGVIGFLLVISAFFILQIVGVITGINFLTPPI